MHHTDPAVRGKFRENWMHKPYQFIMAGLVAKNKSFARVKNNICHAALLLQVCVNEGKTNINIEVNYH